MKEQFLNYVRAGAHRVRAGFFQSIQITIASMGALEALQGAVKVGQDGLSVGEWTSPGAQGAAGLVEPAPGPAGT